MNQDQREIPGQLDRAFTQTSEKPRELKLIEEAQDLGILSPAIQLSLPEGVNKKIGLRGFFFGKIPFGLRIEGSWTGRNSVNLLPIGLQTTNQGWRLLFMPMFRNETAVIIPDFGNDPSIKGINVALPLKEFPTDKLSEVIDLVTHSRKILIYPHTGLSKIPDYDVVRDKWNIYLNARGSELPEEVKNQIESAPSENQKRYGNQYRGI